MPIQIAIPDTALSDSTDLRQKTAKLGQIARSLAIFRVERIIIYPTKHKYTQKKDSSLISKILSYIDTPQYLRFRIFPRSPALKFAGILPPLRTQSHPLDSKSSHISEGDLRWGIQIRPGEIDLGLDKPVHYPKSVSEHKATLFRVIKVYPSIRLESITRDETDVYFGFDVLEIDDLVKFLENSPNTTRIGLTRNGVQYHRQKDEIVSMCQNNKSVILVLGGPRFGIRELVESKDDLKKNIDFWINVIQDQGTETIRLEEALHASLAILSPSLGPFVSKSGFYS
ncbi:MAG: putative RNA uridine N3 methyltransferase [Candidatus Thorarchaeota archaeon]